MKRRASKRLSGTRPGLNDRRSGLLLHLSSLPGPYGCGDLGPGAYRFAEFLQAAGQSWWQTLPVNPIGLGHSPYSTTCSFAGEPLYIALEGLVAESLLKPSEIVPPPDPTPDRTDYRRARRYREVRLKKAFRRFAAGEGRIKASRVARFLDAHRFWIDDFALFNVLATKFKTRNWRRWPAALRRRRASALAQIRADHRTELNYIQFLQYLFFTQWLRLKADLGARGIGLIGDIPLFVGYQSSDVWAGQRYFQLRRDGSMPCVAGVPPDYYCPDGQLWGNPLYNWGAMQKDGFAWWVERLRHMTTLFDVVRLDHFIGFHRCWEVKAGSKTARHGRFRRTPGRDLFLALEDALGELPFIAEDLGTVVPGVYAMRDEFGLPGMRVLQFGFGNEASAAYHLPFSYVPNAVVYTGTHDNDTVVGWYAEAQGNASQGTVDPARCRGYLEGGARTIHWAMIREAMKSVANLTIIPVQDILGLGGQARMNIPGTATGNWRWRLADKALTARLAHKLRRATRVFGRHP
ncbi:MAG: 4-alpha-glucanotransferase [Desulfobacterales bacterium]|nr:4-alpha-glucanotransferase [Desulfobacterales bacterium]